MEKSTIGPRRFSGPPLMVLVLTIILSQVLTFPNARSMGKDSPDDLAQKKQSFIKRVHQKLSEKYKKGANDKKKLMTSDLATIGPAMDDFSTVNGKMEAPRLGRNECLTPSTITSDWKALDVPLGSKDFNPHADISDELNRNFSPDNLTANFLKDPEAIFLLFKGYKEKHAEKYPQDADNFNVPEFREIVEKMLKDMEIRKRRGVPRDLLKIFGEELASIEAFLQNAVNNGNFPYKDTLLNIAAYTQILSCLYDGQEGLQYFVLHRKGKICNPDKEHFNHWMETVKGNLNMERNPAFHIPSTAPLTIQNFNAIRDSGVRLLGLVPTKVQRFDGAEDSPFGFFMHDLFHSSEMGTGTKVVFRENSSSNENLEDKEKIWRENKLRLDRALDLQVSKHQDPEQREIHELVFFYLTHELDPNLRRVVGTAPTMPFDLTALKNALHSYRQTKRDDKPSDLAGTLIYRLIDAGDMGDALQGSNHRTMLAPIIEQVSAIKNEALKGLDDDMVRTFQSYGSLAAYLHRFASDKGHLTPQMAQDQAKISAKIDQAMDEILSAIEELEPKK